MTSPNQGLSSLAPGGGKMRDPGNEVDDDYDDDVDDDNDDDDDDES